MKRMHFKRTRTAADAHQSKRSIGLKRSLLIVASVGAIIAVVDKRRGTSMEGTVRAEGASIRSRMKAAALEASAHEEWNASFHWDQLLDLLPNGMRSVGMTERQAQVGMGVIRQKTYQQIARETHLDERTVRQHAASAFRKVGCTRKSEFMVSLIARLNAGTDADDNQRTG